MSNSNSSFCHPINKPPPLGAFESHLSTSPYSLPLGCPFALVALPWEPPLNSTFTPLEATVASWWPLPPPPPSLADKLLTVERKRKRNSEREQTNEHLNGKVCLLACSLTDRLATRAPLSFRLETTTNCLRNVGRS